MPDHLFCPRLFPSLLKLQTSPKIKECRGKLEVSETLELDVLPKPASVSNQVFTSLLSRTNRKGIILQLVRFRLVKRKNILSGGSPVSHCC